MFVEGAKLFSVKEEGSGDLRLRPTAFTEPSHEPSRQPSTEVGAVLTLRERLMKGPGLEDVTDELLSRLSSTKIGSAALDPDPGPEDAGNFKATFESSRGLSKNMSSERKH